MLLAQSLTISTILASLTLHPDNPRLFLWQDQLTILLTSGEHYGAVLNLDFDYVPYLAELARHGLNQTRTFSGTYREIPGSFGITGNTLAPQPLRYCAPWARSTTPGYADGGPKFDLTRYDPAYFERLRDFVRTAGTRGIVVEYVLFCPFYNDDLWRANPMSAANNINGVGDHPSNEAYTGQHAPLQAVQEAFVREAVRQLNEFDNLYFEICNEPYCGGVTLAWQARIAEVITATEADLPKRHLIAQNIANDWAKVEAPDPRVSIFNFHYASPPRAVAENWDLRRPIGFDETGFAGSDNAVYRRQAWQFILAGGSEFSNLDYSFTPEAESGDATVQAPGGGGADLRAALGVLGRFWRTLDPLHAVPLELLATAAPDGVTVSSLGVPERVYGLYVVRPAGGAEPVVLALALPDGDYNVDYVDVLSGAQRRAAALRSVAGRAELVLDTLAPDLAVRLTKE